MEAATEYIFPGTYNKPQPHLGVLLRALVKTATTVYVDPKSWKNVASLARGFAIPQVTERVYRTATSTDNVVKNAILWDLVVWMLVQPYTDLRTTLLTLIQDASPRSTLPDHREVTLKEQRPFGSLALQVRKMHAVAVGWVAKYNRNFRVWCGSTLN